MNRRIRNRLIRAGVAAVAFAAAFITFKFAELPEKLWYIELIAYLAIYAVVAYDVVIKAFKVICGGHLLDENFLMVIATVGAFCVREYPEAAAVMLFYQVGEIFQAIAVGKSRKSITALMDIRPDTATVIRDGERITVDPDEVEVGEVIEVRPGERIALDGVVKCGEGEIDTSALTGESMPRSVKAGDEVLSGSICLNSVIEITATKEFGESTASKILDLVENAAGKKAKAENFITKFAKIYTPVVVGLAVLTAVIPGAITRDWLEWIHRALMFLVVSCPCALVISVPLAFFGGIGAASTRGVLVKGGNYLELLSKLDTVVFDKTGTLTLGKFSVTKTLPEDRAAEVLTYAAIAESGSNHPIAQSIISAAKEAGREISCTIGERREIAGRGVSVTFTADGIEHTVLAGNYRLMTENGVSAPEADEGGTVVYVALDGKYLGLTVIADTVKADAREVIESMHRDGVSTVMLTGDNEKTAKAVAKEVGVEKYRASLLPEDKVAALEEILYDKKKGSVVAFCGDGINDAPALSRADLGLAMGGVGSDSAIEAADVVLMHDSLSAIPAAKKIAKKTMTVATENIAFALIVKIAILVLSALGITDMWWAIFADVGVTVLAVLNSLRVIIDAGRAKDKKTTSEE